ncbi:hypothetical protein COO60DRAFT_360143 [Scenedesmus sp. NREL 46B-D3]|nr:hypothetical protein COO60DRAFT_360143 [Scenedesmus sp. NREL 46B-D3]
MRHIQTQSETHPQLNQTAAVALCGDSPVEGCGSATSTFPAPTMAHSCTPANAAASDDCLVTPPPVIAVVTVVAVRSSRIRLIRAIRSRCTRWHVPTGCSINRRGRVAGCDGIGRCLPEAIKVVAASAVSREQRAAAVGLWCFRGCGAACQLGLQSSIHALQDCLQKFGIQQQHTSLVSNWMPGSSCRSVHCGHRTAHLDREDSRVA